MTEPIKRHPRDISDTMLHRALSESHRPDLLEDLATTARKAFGFFTSHYPHTINYTWVLEHLEALPAGAAILDLGSGISPLPLILARNGMRVDCVDGSSTIRKPPVAPSWNEWGFFDYAVLDARIHAENCKCRNFKPARLYDRVYSVSVIAHMPRLERNEALGLMRLWLRPGGRMLLAVDLMPSSDFLWNRSEGREVATPEIHGTVADLCSRIKSLGLRIAERRIVRGPHESRTDLLLVECVLPFK